MIRWQSRTDNYSFKSNHVDVKQKNEVSVSLALPWVAGITQDKIHKHVDSGNRESTSYKVENWSGALFPLPVLPTPGTSSGQSVSRQRETSELPLLYIPTNLSHEVQTSAVAEGLSSGAVCGTTGAAAGALLCVMFGPVGASVALWSACGFGATAVVVGTAQGCAVAENNRLRGFAEDCNEFLEWSREKGLDEDAVAMYKALIPRADTEQKKQLLRDIETVCVDVLGAVDARPITAAASNLPAPPRPEPRPTPVYTRPSNTGYSSGYSYGGLSQGYYHSPAGAVAAAMGGR